MHSHVFKRLTRWQAEQIVLGPTYFSLKTCSLLNIFFERPNFSVFSNTNCIFSHWRFRTQLVRNLYLFRAYSPIMILVPEAIR